MYQKKAKKDAGNKARCGRDGTKKSEMNEM